MASPSTRKVSHTYDLGHVPERLWIVPQSPRGQRVNILPVTISTSRPISHQRYQLLCQPHKSLPEASYYSYPTTQRPLVFATKQESTALAQRHTFDFAAFDFAVDAQAGQTIVANVWLMDALHLQMASYATVLSRTIDMVPAGILVLSSMCIDLQDDGSEMHSVT